MLSDFTCSKTGFSLKPFDIRHPVAEFVECMWRPNHLMGLANPAFHSVSLARYTQMVSNLGSRLHHALLLNDDDDEAREAIFAWRARIFSTINKQIHGGHDPALWAPVGTMDLFDDAFERGLISHVAWSAAVRFCYLDWFSINNFDGSRPRRFLEPLARADVRGLMNPSERDHVAALPEVVTFYRTARTRTAEQAVQGISWTHLPSYIETHIRHGEQVARCNGACPATYSRQAGWSSDRKIGEERDWVVEVKFPRSAIRAWIEPHDYEYLVDYRLAVPGSVKIIPVAQSFPSSASIEAARRYLAQAA